METILEAGSRYIDMGFSVVPLARGTRVPPKGFTLAKYFSERATKENLAEWCKQYPGCNLGIITGQISGVCAVDLDKDKKEFDEKIELEYFSDSLLTPISKTPSGGRHLYFRTPNGTRIGPKTGILPAIDLRCDDSYIVAPPSVLYDGKRYEWIEGMEIGGVEIAELPVAFLSKILGRDNTLIYNNINSTIYKGDVTDGTNCNEQSVTPVTSRYIWEDGSRDTNLYYVSQCLADCNADKDYIAQVLRAIVSSWGEVNETWIQGKIASAFSKLSKKDKNWQEDVDRFIAVTDGIFSVTNAYISLHAVTKQDKGAVRIALSRRKDKLIRKVGSKDGVYEKIQQDIEFIQFEEGEEKPFPVVMPMGLNNLVEISSGNIILVAGEYNAGKTTFLLNLLASNKNKIPIRYLSSEMDASEFKKRFRGFNLPLDFWKPDDMSDYIKLKIGNNYHNCLKPDGLNIIDYLEFRESDYTLGAEIMRQIHDALGKGICVVAIQKKEGTRLPRSGDLVLEKPRLAIALSKCPGEKEEIIAEILKAKITILGKCDGKKAKYEILDRGSRLKETRAWGYWSESYGSKNYQK